jgi:cytochrome c oxidase subunit 2
MTKLPSLLLLVWAYTLSGVASADSYFPCRSCHGDEGLGSSAINTPPIAGQLEGYLARQLANFRDGVRGDRPGDTYGGQMALMAATLDDAAIVELAAIIAAMPTWQSPNGPEPTSDGELYQPCAACHGAKGEGNAALLAPRIIGMDARYLARQLRNFRDGIRGTNPKDTAGLTMRAALSGSPDDTTIEKLSSYIENM